MKTIRLLGVCLAAAFALVACNQKTAEPAETAVTDNLYQFAVVNGTGDTVSLADYQGKVLLVVKPHCVAVFTTSSTLPW